MTFLNYMLQLVSVCVPLWNNYVIYLFVLAFLATAPYLITEFFNRRR